MSNSYGKVYSPYEDLPSDVEPSSNSSSDLAEAVMNTFAESYAGPNLDSVQDGHIDSLREIMGEDVDTDISDITDVDSRIDTSDDDSVYAGLHEKLNLVINSHRLIIDRLDGIDDRLAGIEHVVDDGSFYPNRANTSILAGHMEEEDEASTALKKAVQEEIEKRKGRYGDT